MNTSIIIAAVVIITITAIVITEMILVSSKQRKRNQQRMLEVTLKQIEERLLYKVKLYRIPMRGMLETWRQSVSAAKKYPHMLEQTIKLSKELERKIDDQQKIKHRN